MGDGRREGRLFKYNDNDKANHAVAVYHDGCCKLFVIILCLYLVSMSIAVVISFLPRSMIDWLIDLIEAYIVRHVP